MKLIGYIRVSSQIQVDEGYSLEEQEKKIRDYCRSNNHIVDFIFDKAESGKKENYKLRKGYNELWRVINEYDGIIVASFNRFGRSFLGLLEDIEKLRALNKQFISLREGITDIYSPSGKLMIGVFSTIAEFQIENMKEARQAGYKFALEHPELRKAGKKPIGHPKMQLNNDLIKLYKAGMSKRLLCDTFKMSLPTLNLRLKEAGLSRQIVRKKEVIVRKVGEENGN